MPIPRSHLFWSFGLHAAALAVALLGSTSRPRVFRCPDVQLLPDPERPALPTTVALPEVEVESAGLEPLSCDPVPALQLEVPEPRPHEDLRAESAWSPACSPLDRTVVVRRAPPAEPPPAEPPPAEPVASQVEEAAAAPLPPPVVLAVLAGTNQPPDYPARARRNGWQGTVLLVVRCGPLGEVVAVELLASSGHPLLDDAALAAVRRWQFSGGPGEVHVPIEFRLRGGA